MFVVTERNTFQTCMATRIVKNPTQAQFFIYYWHTLDTTGKYIHNIKSSTIQNLRKLVFDLSRTIKCKSNDTAGFSINDFQLVFNRNSRPNLALLRVQAFTLWVTLTFAFQGQPKLNLMVQSDSQYMISYRCLVVTYGLTRLGYDFYKT